MPIEFNCPQCQQLLRVPDESAGAKARCAQCEAIVDVPQSGAGAPYNPFSDGQQQQPTKPDAANPYVSPVSDLGKQHGGPTLSGKMAPTAVEPGPVISHAWDVWKANLGILVGVTVIVLGINIGISTIQNIFIAIVEDQGEPAIGALISLVFSFVGNVVQVYLGIGQAQICLKLLRGQSAAMGELFGGGPLFLRTFGASFLFGIAMLVGFAACIVPGILLMLFFWPFYWLIIDEKASALDSFGMARPYAQENAGTTFLLWLASAAIIIIGMLALCVGILFAAPLVTMIWATAYLMMTGQLQSQPR